MSSIFQRFHMHALIYDIRFSAFDLLHSVWQTLCSSTQLQITQFCSFLWLSVPLYICTTSLSIYLLMEIQVAFMSWLLQIVLQWTLGLVHVGEEGEGGISWERSADIYTRPYGKWLPWRLSDRESACQCRRRGFDPWVGKTPWRRKWQYTEFSCLGSPMDRGAWWGFSPWVAKELDTT